MRYEGSMTAAHVPAAIRGCLVRWWTWLALASCLPSSLPAQADDVPILSQTVRGLQAEEAALTQQVEQLADGQRLLSLAAVVAGTKAPQPRALRLASPRTTELTPTALAAQARAGLLRVGWCYLCADCDHWHTAMGAGYAITADGAIVTCAHVVDPPPQPMRRGGLVAVLADGTVHPVKGVLAFDPTMDAAILDLQQPTSPQSLATEARPGDLAYCCSRPLEQRDYFAAGLINRFYLDHDVAPEHGRGTLPHAAAVRMDVGLPWAPGSSGAALFDGRGNVIGHASEIRTLCDGLPVPGMPEDEANAPGEPPGTEAEPAAPATLDDLEAMRTLLTLHVAIPARGVQLLAAQANAAAGTAK